MESLKIVICNHNSFVQRMAFSTRLFLGLLLEISFLTLSFFFYPESALAIDQQS